MKHLIALLSLICFSTPILANSIPKEKLEIGISHCSSIYGNYDAGLSLEGQVKFRIDKDTYLNIPFGTFNSMYRSPYQHFYKPE